MTNKIITARDRMLSKVADAKVNKMINQREKMIGNYFNNFPPTEREKEIYNVYEAMKDELARYPKLIEDLNDAYMYIFNETQRDEIIIKKGVINKFETEKLMKQIRFELELKLKVFEKIN